MSILVARWAVTATVVHLTVRKYRAKGDGTFALDLP